MSFDRMVQVSFVLVAVVLSFGCTKSSGGTQSKLAIGDGCTRNSDCASNVCETEDPGGQCTQACSTSASCGDGNVCNDEGKCYPGCTVNGDCRENEGYSCQGTTPDMFCDVAPPAMDVNVELRGDKFVPENVTVAVGGTVHWVNHDSHAHTVTSGASSSATDVGSQFDQQMPNSGDTFDFTFDNAGDQPYFCRFHESFGMKGTVTVEAP